MKAFTLYSWDINPREAVLRRRIIETSNLMQGLVERLFKDEQVEHRADFWKTYNKVMNGTPFRLETLGHLATLFFRISDAAKTYYLDEADHPLRDAVLANCRYTDATADEILALIHSIEHDAN